MLTKQEVWLYSNQSSQNIAYTAAAAATLSASELVEPLNGAKLDFEVLGQDVQIVAGSFDQDLWVPGEQTAKGTLVFPLNPAKSSSSTEAGTTAPHWGTMIQGLCDFSQGIASTNKFTYTPISTPAYAGMIQRYYGNVAATSSIIDRFYNLKADWKIGFEANKYPTIEFSVSGAFAGQTESVTSPSITKARNTPYSFKGATISIAGGSTLKVINAEFSGGQSVATRKDPSESGGVGVSEITDRKIKFKVKAYAVIGSSLLTSLTGQTEAAFSLQWGPTYRVMSIAATYAQFTKMTKADENGVTVWEMEGQCNRNDFTIKLNP